MGASLAAHPDELRGAAEEQARCHTLSGHARELVRWRVSSGRRFDTRRQTPDFSLIDMVPTPQPTTGTIPIGDRLWRMVMRYDLERHCASISLAWGLWLITLQPLHVMNPSMRGFWLLAESTKWLPWNADWTWGTAVMLPAIAQLVMISRESKYQWRGFTIIMQATTFLFIVLLLILDNWRSTGIPMYGGLALAHLISYAQIAMKRFAALPHE